jgi:NADPH-dependent 2,4-dienoyl-CoA reductase/sulfur reductase-like enzyme/nitrite reductase/ring-hydroxylating ferredoxin subunit
MGGQTELSGPDLQKDGVVARDIADGAMLQGHANGEAVLLVRRGDSFLAVGATCTHYGGPLAEGLLVGNEVHCPWHHACFDVRTGEAVRAPALNALACFKVEQKDGRVFVTGKDERTRLPVAPKTVPSSVVVVGAGAAGNAAAEMLRRRGYDGKITLVGKDADDPVDRPNLSKDYLAGNAPEEWIPVRGADFYAEQKIDRLTGVEARAIDTKARTVTLSDGRSLAFGALLLATGADPVKLPLPGADLPHVHCLRTLADSRAIIARATGGAKRAVVLGASFIGLEVAASLRARGLEVDVVAPEARPLERVLGAEVGDLVRAVHEEHGVRFHLGEKSSRIEAARVVLESGKALDADLVVIGVGVRPQVALAEAAGLEIDNGVVVNERLETGVPGIYAAGDIARYPYPRSSRRARVEHWVHAERQGQVAAENILGAARTFDEPPFFWSAHYDLVINYVGHVDKVERVQIAGNVKKRDATIAYRDASGKVGAVATIGRDGVNLRAAEALAKDDQAALDAMLR